MNARRRLLLDALHIVKLGTQVVDESDAACSRSSCPGGATGTIRATRSAGCSGTGREHLSESQDRELQLCLELGNSPGEVELALSCYKQVRTVYSGTGGARERQAPAEKVMASSPTCRVPEVVRLGRTLRAWRTQVLAYNPTGGLGNVGTGGNQRAHREGPTAGARSR